MAHLSASANDRRVPMHVHGAHGHVGARASRVLRLHDLRRMFQTPRSPLALSQQRPGALRISPRHVQHVRVHGSVYQPWIFADVFRGGAHSNSAWWGLKFTVRGDVCIGTNKQRPTLAHVSSRVPRMAKAQAQPAKGASRRDPAHASSSTAAQRALRREYSLPTTAHMPSRSACGAGSRPHRPQLQI